MSAVIAASASPSSPSISTTASPQTPPTVPLEEFLNGQPVDEFISALPLAELSKFSLHDMQATLLLLLGRYSRFRSAEDLERILHALPYYADLIQAMSLLSGIATGVLERANPVPHALDIATRDSLDKRPHAPCEPTEEWTNIISVLAAIEKRPSAEILPMLARALAS